ncbi:hypothetical protein TeGR_g5100 [Tetraparma gracilis]|uniref:NAD(P)-binding domain-containing protein n=1 Tax=Tetraparma gracilis TaxID=2962635 RepID=A0ABQ6N024_9STRA|nr:hypothetical protein TeGR_g5100 [Tetraparma gracilis]
MLLPSLSSHSVTVLCRNAFLASAPSRASGDFGHLGAPFLARNAHVALRDWDGGDLLDIVGQDWVGWQDVLGEADVLVNAVGGYTGQRLLAQRRLSEAVAAAERVRMDDIRQIVVRPSERFLPFLSPAALDIKRGTLAECSKAARTGADVTVVALGRVVEDVYRDRCEGIEDGICESDFVEMMVGLIERGESDLLSSPS